VHVEYRQNTAANQSIITNPQAIVDILNPQNLLRRELSQQGLCQIFDEIIRIVLSCQPNNALWLFEFQSQPLEHLKLHFTFFNNSNFESSDVVRQFILQNNVNLAKINTDSQIQNLIENNQKLILKYG